MPFPYAAPCSLGLKRAGKKEGSLSARMEQAHTGKKYIYITHERPTEVKSDGSSYTQEHTHINTQAGGMAKVKEKR